jgi:hypothetical protein
VRPQGAEEAHPEVAGGVLVRSADGIRPWRSGRGFRFRAFILELCFAYWRVLVSLPSRDEGASG